MFKSFVISAGLLLGSAVANSQDVVIDFPAGLGCADFDLRVGLWESPHRVYREFTDKAGNVVRFLSAGQYGAMSFTNLSTNASVQLPSKGGVNQSRWLADGTEEIVATGLSVVIWFPTDIPPGPSTIQYVGRLNYTIDPSGVWTQTNFTGKSYDICAMLGG